MDPILLTSIAPGGSEQQNLCVNSWRDKYSVYSLNKEKEIPELQREFPWIVFVVAKNTGENKFKKPLVSISEFKELALLLKRDFIIINADILLTGSIVHYMNGIGVGTRYDYEDNIENAKATIMGFDYFYIPFKYVHVLDNMEMYYLGMCWWDYVLPLRAIQLQIPIYEMRMKIAFHKSHPINYSSHNRRYMEQVVMVMEKMEGFRETNAKGINIFCYSKILKHLK